MSKIEKDIKKKIKEGERTNKQEKKKKKKQHRYVQVTYAFLKFHWKA